MVEIRHELRLSNPKAHYTCVSQIVALGITEDEASAKTESKELGKSSPLIMMIKLDKIKNQMPLNTAQGAITHGFHNPT